MRSGLLWVISLFCLFLSGTILEAQSSDSSSAVFIPKGDSVQILNDGTKLALTRIRSTKQGAIVGAVTGGTVGLIGGTILASNMSTLFGGRRNFPKALGTGVLIGAGGAVSFGLIGAGLGYLVSREEWKRVSVQGTSVSVSF